MELQVWLTDVWIVPVEHAFCFSPGRRVTGMVPVSILQCFERNRDGAV